MKMGTPVAVWLAGSLLLLVFPARFWTSDAAKDPLSAPVTPLDRTDASAARQWLFLRRAATIVPPGATYTVIAPAGDVEMNLFMMSLGLLPRARPLPSSYYSVPAPQIGSRARYVLAYQNAAVGGPIRVRAVFDEGRVYERPWVR